jgi:hypothetical protein
MMLPVSAQVPSPDTSAAAPRDGVCQDGVVGDWAVGGHEVRMTLSEARVRTGRRERRIRLDDPAHPGFLDVPAVGLDDGRSLRDVAFGVWAANVRARIAAGARWETTYLARRPYHTAFAMVGAALIGGGSLWSFARWASSDPQVSRRPGLAGSLALLGACALLLWIAYATLSSAARYWLCRRGSYLRIDASGVSVAKGTAAVPPSDVTAAVHHPWLRVTELRLRDGRRVWIPREKGPLVRPDLVLAALTTPR